ncbi:cupin domain [Streptomyces sp. BK208]|uniref:cupin domain-containing protein n=1 Tax=Streptomyces sp. BK208 TaxID=2512150 RepID=UPI00105DB34F|nr:cupin domain-containing protein [Streptomyces sp. BK208]TDT39638.1 cupin domain [Streptomyces sp. BK208]
MDWNIVAAGDGRHVGLGDGAELIVKEDGSRTRGNLVVAEMTIPPDFVAPPQHVHHAHEEAWFVLDGIVEFTSGTRLRRVDSGDWVLVPLGVPHTFHNPGSEPARFLTIMTPNLYLDYFIELGERTTRALRETPEPAGEVRTRISGEIMQKYRTEVTTS